VLYAIAPVNSLIDEVDRRTNVVAYFRSRDSTLPNVALQIEAVAGRKSSVRVHTTTAAMLEGVLLLFA
jgi:hypothetical protein